MARLFPLGIILDGAIRSLAGVARFGYAAVHGARPAGAKPIMRAKVRIYLAGPLGFSEAGRHFHNAVLAPFVRSLGYEVLDPWTLTDARKIKAVEGLPYGPAKREAWRALNREMGATNRAAIDAADAVVAVLDGVDVDSGTAAEIGYAFGRGKPIVGYRGDFRLSADNEGSTVNLQVEYFIRESGGTIVERYEDLEAGLRSLAARRAAPPGATVRRRPGARGK
jgi:nucleoside 2-deoxyribosyltransferase